MTTPGADMERHIAHMAPQADQREPKGAQIEAPGLPVETEGAPLEDQKSTEGPKTARSQKRARPATRFFKTLRLPR